MSLHYFPDQVDYDEREQFKVNRNDADQNDAGNETMGFDSKDGAVGLNSEKGAEYDGDVSDTTIGSDV